MLGAIVGDIVGSYYEHFPTKSTDFDLFSDPSFFTDDTVLTIAVAEWILNGGDLVSTLQRYVNRYPNAGYGASFLNWAMCGDTEPYNSWGNGAAMRVSPVAYAAETLEQALELAERSSAVTHDHPDGIRGAQATAGSVFIARTGGSKDDIRQFVTTVVGYDLSRSIAQIRPDYIFDVSCNGSVPESVTAFLESNSFEDAIRIAVSLGGDADTMACIAGAIAEPFYGGVPAEIWQQAKERLDDSLLLVVEQFLDKFS